MTTLDRWLFTQITLFCSLCGCSVLICLLLFSFLFSSIFFSLVSWRHFHHVHHPDLRTNRADCEETNGRESVLHSKHSYFSGFLHLQCKWYTPCNGRTNGLCLSRGMYIFYVCTYVIHPVILYAYVCMLYVLLVL